jgi:uncharacterized protein (TIGR00255 family)
MSNSAARMAAPVRSMTGYARVRRETALGELTVSLRGVNHRGLDLHFHQSLEFSPFENATRALLKSRICRGHVEVRCSLTRDQESNAAGINRGLLGRYIAAYRAAAQEFGVMAEPDLNMAMRIPGVFDAEAAAEGLDTSFESDMVSAFDACSTEYNATREKEGSLLAAQMFEEIGEILSQAAQMHDIRNTAVGYFRQRLEERLSELLATSTIEPRRLAEEAAILADRSDIREELTRLTIHTNELGAILKAGGEVGKRLDFLLQEMNRETNTILSKTSGLGEQGLTITNLALVTKANIEKIREQALNLE